MVVTDKTFVYAILEKDRESGNYHPVIVYEDDPELGRTDLDFGTDRGRALRLCDELNAKSGIDLIERDRIVLSSIRASFAVART